MAAGLFQRLHLESVAEGWKGKNNYHNKENSYSAASCTLSESALQVSWLVGALNPVNHKGLHQG